MLIRLVTVTVMSLALYPPLRWPDAAPFFVFSYLLIVAVVCLGAGVLFAPGHELSKTGELGSYRILDPPGRNGRGSDGAEVRSRCRPNA